MRGARAKSVDRSPWFRARIARTLRLVGLVALWSIAAPGCDPGTTAPPPARTERLGILADLVLFDRPASRGGAFFLDRFEATVGDWQAFVERVGISEAEGAAWNAESAPNCAATGVSLDGARRFARDRLGRLPTLDEWRFAAGAGDRFSFPWGDSTVRRSLYAATAELGLRSPVAVGTFASGAAEGVGGHAVYDLIGNAAEWTETLRDGPRRGLRDVLDPSRRLRRARVLSPFHWPYPETVLLGVLDDRVPRAVAPGLERSLQRAGVDGVIAWSTPAERSSLRGVRVATDPRTLLLRMARLRGEVTESERVALGSFLRQSRVRELLRAADSYEPGLLGEGGEVAAYLRRELRR